MKQDLVQMSAAAAGQRTLIDAKMKEFEGYRLVGEFKAAEECRRATHDLLDAWFDAQGAFAEDVRRGRFL